MRRTRRCPPVRAAEGAQRLAGGMPFNVDKITTVPKRKVGARIGRLDDEDILRLNRAVLVFLGLGVSPRAKQEA